ncbi:MAG: cation:proton antiporter [Anaerolineae bacterium]|nr:cation:proton antiporter [Anaerolineae bacterium]
MEFSGDFDTLALVGITILGAFAVGQLFRYLGIPQVVGFIVAGTLLGVSGLRVIPDELNNSLLFVSHIALALIGFDMGEHLRLNQLRKMGRSITIIVILQALGAFVLVAGGVYLITSSTATALVFGAIAMATAPAATVDVLAEYGAEGPMTTTLLTVIGIDDALTLLVFSIIVAMVEPLLANSGGVSLLDVLTGGGEISLWDMIELPLKEIGGSILLGIAFGYALTWIMNYIHRHHAADRRQHDAMAVCIAAVLLGAGLSLTWHFSLILTTMTMGFMVVNLNQENGRYIRFTIEHAGPVIYVLFFALVGARFDISLLPEMGMLGLAYIVLRIVGKYSGAWVGGVLSGAPLLVRNNLGLGLLSQAGVAIGLALDCSCRFAELGPKGADLGVLVLNVVTATTFVVQLIGPVMVKVAITRAGEIGKALDETQDAVPHAALE